MKLLTLLIFLLFCFIVIASNAQKLDTVLVLQSANVELLHLKLRKAVTQSVQHGLAAVYLPETDVNGGNGFKAVSKLIIYQVPVSVSVTPVMLDSITRYIAKITENSAPPVETITTNIDNVSAVYSGTWVRGTLAGWHDNTFSYSNEVGATVEYTFRGKKVDVYSERLHTHGIIEVLLDGVKVQDVDLYSTTKILPAMVLSVNATEFNSSGVKIDHKLTIRVSGRKNPASIGTYGLSDYIKVYSTK